MHVLVQSLLPVFDQTQVGSFTAIGGSEDRKVIIEDGVGMITQLLAQNAFINCGECWQYADWAVVFFQGRGHLFLNIGVTWAILSWVSNVSLAFISLAILAIYLEITGAAALSTFGWIASTPVVFLGSK